MDKDRYRETGTLFKRSPLVSSTSGSFVAKVRAVVADHKRQLQGVMSRAKLSQGRFTQGMAGKKRTWLPGGVLVETWINPYGLVPTLKTRVTFAVEYGYASITLLHEHGYRIDYLNTPSRIFVPDSIVTVFDELKAVFAPITCETDSLGEDIESISWVLHSPELDDLSSYLMRGSKPSLNPWRYSGLTRLLAQSNDVNELWEGVRNQLPYNVGEFYDSVAWSLPSSVGCIRSPAGEYWVILTPQNLGIYGFKLTAHPITPTLLKIAEDTALSATIREIADSWILALCSTKNAEVVELVSATDSQYINAHLDFEHISYWGFQWRYQHRGAPDEHLCGAIGRNSRSFTPTFTDLITKLDFSWVEEQEEEILTCSIISNSSGLDPTQKIRYHTWYDSEGNINYLDAIFAWDNFYSIARVAAFSFNDGELLCGVPGWVEEDYYSYLAIHGDPPVGTTYNAVSYFVSIYRGESPNSFWIINGGDPVDCVVPTWRIYEARFMDIGRGELLFDGWDLIDYGCVTLDQGNLYVNEILSDMDQETFDAFMQQYLDALNNPTEEIPGPISNGFLRTILFPTNVSYAKNSFIWNSPYPFPVSPLGRWVGAA